jgi:hypothetical protein
LLLDVALFTAGCITKESSSTGAPVSNPPPASGVDTESNLPAGTSTTTYTEAEWQKKLETDAQKSNEYKVGIGRQTGNGRAFGPISTKKLVLTESRYSVELVFTDLPFSPAMLVSTLNSADLHTGFNNGQDYIKPGQKLPFETMPIQFESQNKERASKSLKTAPYIAMEGFD